MDCLFCKIINGEINSYPLYEDDIVKVILDAFPQSNGHMLIIPKKHIMDFTLMDNDTLSHINDVAKMMSKKIFDVLKPQGLSLVVNYGSVQAIKHYHLHLIPKYEKSSMIDVQEIYNKFKNHK